MEKWVDGLGEVPFCKNCKILPKADSIAVKPDYGSLFSNRLFSKTLLNKLTYIRENDQPDKHYYVSLSEYAANPTFTHEELYNTMKYPDAGYRLLALFRYWNTIHYFSPNRQLITEDWNKVLPLFIPQIINAGNQNAYVNTMVRLISTTHDTHAFIRSEIYDSNLGKYKLPFQARFVEDQLVVTGYYKDTLGVKEKVRPGDVITAINGEKISSLIKRYLPVISASNDAAALRDMPSLYLLRSNNSQFKLALERDKKPLQIIQQGPENSKIDDYYWKSDPGKPGYQLIDANTGYIHCANYKNSDLNSIKKLFKDTKGIIVDMRNYPTNEMVNTIASYFKPDSTAFVKFTRGYVNHPGMFTYTQDVKNGTRTNDFYKGRIVVIVNETTQSNAEFVTMAFQSAANVTVIGSTTAGADGNISEIYLPGNITTWISGLGVYYPDGTNAQRTGVKIDQIVKPTINGIKNGIDEPLEEAKRIILTQKPTG